MCDVCTAPARSSLCSSSARRCLSLAADAAVVAAAGAAPLAAVPSVDIVATTWAPSNSHFLMIDFFVLLLISLFRNLFLFELTYDFKRGLIDAFRLAEAHIVDELMAVHVEYELTHVAEQRRVMNGSE